MAGATRNRTPAAVTFDCWQTLLHESDWELAHKRRVAALARAAQEAGRTTSDDEAGAAFDAAWTHHMDSWRNGVQTGAEQVALEALARLGLRDPHPALEHLVSRRHLTRAACSPSKGLRRLWPRSRRLARAWPWSATRA